MKFDGNLAWKQAAAWVSANRDVLVALAGVFFLVPGLAVSLFGPTQPVPVAGMTRDQLMTLTRGYYLQALPYVVPMLILQALGSLAVLTLVTDRKRPTVGESIRHALGGVVPYVLAQLILGMGVGIAGGIVTVAAGLTGVPAALFVAIGAFVVLAIYLVVRTSLSGPAIAIERVRNPVIALRRSWELTRGNSGRIVLFYLILGVLFSIIMAVVNTVIGILLALALSAVYAQIVLAVVSSVLSAAVTVYFVAILAAAHRQLAGPALGDQRATFE